MKKELELILKTVLIEKNEKEKSAVDVMLEENLNWINIAGILLNHRLGGYFITGLECRQKEEIPSELKKALEMLVLGQKKKQEELIPEIKEISCALEQTDINFAGLKGIIFGTEMYKAGARLSNDLDILVYENDLEKLDNVLRKLGYIQSFCGDNQLVEATKKEKVIQRMNYHDLVPYVKRTADGHINVDINFLFDGKENVIDEKVFKMGTQKFKGEEYEFRGLNVYTGLAFLCTHFYREATEEIWINSKRHVTLYKLIDIINFIRKYKMQIDMQIFIETMDMLNLMDKSYCVFHIIKEFYNEEFVIDFCNQAEEKKKLNNGKEESEKIKNIYLKDVYESVSRFEYTKR